ncbi:MAG: (Fe-S)-binding protein [Thaumarchaeota archaeon]|nr:MAG: (Fe-S)-binding protein [Nitrososphaerota archaeon]
MFIDNIRRYRLPLPVEASVLTSWAYDLEIPRDKEVVMYTGGLYQLVPYIQSTVNYLEGLEGRKGVGLAVKIGKALRKVIDFAKVIAKPSRDAVKRQMDILKAIALALRKINVDFGYLYEEEPYSGVLLHDLGMEDEFKKHAKLVVDLFKERGVKKVITIDPHSTYAFKHLYPKFLGATDFDVVNYIEILAKSDFKGRCEDISYVIHDPCIYARYENLIDELRSIIEALNVKYVEPENSRELTYCCGGPIEVLSPRLAKKVAERRVEELRRYGKRILVACPICYANLKRAAGEELEIYDLSEIIARCLI